jgi:hypothetical protein
MLLLIMCAAYGLSVQIMSDLHLEAYFHNQHHGSGPGYEVFDCNPSSPMLALLGDIGLTVHDGLFHFLQRQLFKYEKIFFVMGNHECYLTTYVSRLSLVASHSNLPMYIRMLQELV